MPSSVFLSNVKMPSSSDRNVPAGSIHPRFGIIKVHSGFLCFFFSAFAVFKGTLQHSQKHADWLCNTKTLNKLYFELFKMDKQDRARIRCDATIKLVKKKRPNCNPFFLSLSWIYVLFKLKLISLCVFSLITALFFPRVCWIFTSTVSSNGAHLLVFPLNYSRRLFFLNGKTREPCKKRGREREREQFHPYWWFIREQIEEITSTGVPCRRRGNYTITKRNKQTE